MMEFTENTGPLQVFSAVVVSDEDNQYLTSPVLSLMAFDGELEVLSVSDQNSNTRNWFSNTGTHTLTLTVSDGTDSSTPAEVILSFKAVSDPPIVYHGGSAQNHPVTFPEDVASA